MDGVIQKRWNIVKMQLYLYILTNDTEKASQSINETGIDNI